MPDLNLRNPAVTAELEDVARFWLDRRRRRRLPARCREAPHRGRAGRADEHARDQGVAGGLQGRGRRRASPTRCSSARSGTPRRSPAAYVPGVARPDLRLRAGGGATASRSRTSARRRCGRRSATRLRAWPANQAAIVPHEPRPDPDHDRARRRPGGGEARRVPAADRARDAVPLLRRGDRDDRHEAGRADPDADALDRRALDGGVHHRHAVGAAPRTTPATVNVDAQAADHDFAARRRTATSSGCARAGRRCGAASTTMLDARRRAGRRLAPDDGGLDDPRHREPVGRAGRRVHAGARRRAAVRAGRRRRCSGRSAATRAPLSAARGHRRGRRLEAGRPIAELAAAERLPHRAGGEPREPVVRRPPAADRRAREIPKRPPRPAFVELATALLIVSGFVSFVTSLQGLVALTGNDDPNAPLVAAVRDDRAADDARPGSPSATGTGGCSASTSSPWRRSSSSRRHGGRSARCCSASIDAARRAVRAASRTAPWFDGSVGCR